MFYDVTVLRAKPLEHKYFSHNTQIMIPYTYKKRPWASCVIYNNGYYIYLNCFTECTYILSSGTDPDCYKLTKKLTTRPAAKTTPSTIEATDMNRYELCSKSLLH